MNHNQSCDRPSPHPPPVPAEQTRATPRKDNNAPVAPGRFLSMGVVTSRGESGDWLIASLHGWAKTLQRVLVQALSQRNKWNKRNKRNKRYKHHSNLLDLPLLRL